MAIVSMAFSVSRKSHVSKTYQRRRENGVNAKAWRRRMLRGERQWRR
jgi:hypothetical protein